MDETGDDQGMTDSEPIHGDDVHRLNLAEVAEASRALVASMREAFWPGVDNAGATAQQIAAATNGLLPPVRVAVMLELNHDTILRLGAEHN